MIQVGWRSAQRVNKQLLHRPFLKHQRVRGVERIVNLLMMNHENNALCAERALTWRGGQVQEQQIPSIILSYSQVLQLFCATILC